MMIIAIIVLAVILQFTAAVLALRLIRITGKSVGWIAISTAIFFMGLRRLISLYDIIILHQMPLEMGFEILGLITSCVMVIGVALIAPIFHAMKDLQDEQQTLIARLEESLAHIHTLKGLLPICASCKKVRDDRGYWTQIEQYISAHTDAEFSHGICPDCAKLVYAELGKNRRQ